LDSTPGVGSSVGFTARLKKAVSRRPATTVDVATAGEQRYDLILMDMQMPHMDGLEAAHPLAGRQRPDALPAMAANAFVEDKARSPGAGMNDFIAKPVEPDVLFAALLSWLDAELEPV